MQKSQRLSVVNGIGETGGVVRFTGSFVGDFANARYRLYVIEECNLRAADRYTQLAVFILVLTSQGNCAFAINKPTYVGCIGVN